MEKTTNRKILTLILFISLNVLLIALTVAALLSIRQPLLEKLNAYEAIQLETCRAECFEELFSQPDWEELYAMAFVEDTPYEGSEAFAAYMEAKVTQPLTYREVYTEQTEEHRYLVLSGDEKIATFTVTPVPGTDSWGVGAVEVFFERTESVTVEKLPGWTVFINGVALDDRFTVRTAETLAEKYLPEGIHGYHAEVQYLDGLLVSPEVTAVDETGSPVTLIREPGTNRYTLPSGPETIPDELWQTARNAAIADANYALGALSAAGLKAYFDETAPLYTMIVKNPLNYSNHTSIYIEESSISVTEYFRYTENLFSARVKLNQNIVRTNGTVKVCQLDKTYFFTKNSSGKYLVTEYTNESVTQLIEQVRLTFVTGSSVSQMVSTDADTVTLPPVEIPEGATFLGWATRSVDENSNATLAIRILPDGSVRGSLEPMELHPVFDSTGTEDTK